MSAFIPAQRTTRRPTCRPSWPLLNISGVAKAGKTYSLLAFSAEPWIDRFFFIEFGESSGDEYGAIPGADFEIVPTDGTYKDLLAALEWAVAQPAAEGKANVVAVDSMSEVWDLLVDEQNIEARRRAARKVSNGRGDATTRAQASGDAEPDVSMDQWNVAKTRWNRLISLLRRHQGPVFITSRLEEVTIMQNGQPSRDKQWKPQVEKRTGFAMTATVQLRKPGTATLTEVQSLALGMSPTDERVMQRFTIADLFAQMKVSVGNVDGSTHAEVNAEASAAIMHAEAVAADAENAPPAERQAVRAQAQPEGGARTLPDANEVAARFQGARERGANVQELRKVGYDLGGPEVLAEVMLTVRGERVSATDVLRGLIAEAEHRARPVASGEGAGRDERFETPAPTPTSAPAPAAPVEQPAAAAVTEARTERAPQAVAEDARQATYAERAAKPRNAMVGRLVEEVENLVLPTLEGAEAEVAAFMAQRKVAALAEVSPITLKRFVVGLRPRTIAALREQGETTMAAAYEALGDGDVPWEAIADAGNGDEPAEHPTEAAMLPSA